MWLSQIVPCTSNYYSKTYTCTFIPCQPLFGDVCCWPEKYLFFEKNGLTEEQAIYEEVLYRYRSLDTENFMADADDLIASSSKLDAYDMNDTMRNIQKYLAGRITTREMAATLEGNVYSGVYKGKMIHRDAIGYISQ